VHHQTAQRGVIRAKGDRKLAHHETQRGKNNTERREGIPIFYSSIVVEVLSAGAWSSMDVLHLYYVVM